MPSDWVASTASAGRPTRPYEPYASATDGSAAFSLPRRRRRSRPSHSPVASSQQRKTAGRRANIVGRETWRHLRHKPEATDDEKRLAQEVFEARKELAEKQGKAPTDVSKPDPIRLDEDTLRTELENCRTQVEKA